MARTMKANATPGGTDEPNPRAVEGNNLSPEQKAREAHAANINDLEIETRNWCDGSIIETQEQHDDLERLRDLITDAEDAADASRKAEKDPLDVKITEIQGFYNPLIGTLKNAPGKTTKMKAACNAALTVWRNKVAAEKAAKAAEMQREADEKFAAAAEAIRQAGASSDLQARDDAEEQLAEASRLASAAKKVEAGATGLRTSWVTTLTNSADALKWAKANRPDALKAALLAIARDDVQAGVRSIPGFDITPERKAT